MPKAHSGQRLNPQLRKIPGAPPAFQMEGADLGEGEGSPVVLVNSSTLPPVWMSFNIARHQDHLCQLEIYHQTPWDFIHAIDFWGQNWELSEH